MKSSEKESTCTHTHINTRNIRNNLQCGDHSPGAGTVHDMFHITSLCNNCQRNGGLNNWEVSKKGSAACNDVPNVGRASVSDTISWNL